jgi:hypothetical protein
VRVGAAAIIKVNQRRNLSAVRRIFYVGAPSACRPPYVIRAPGTPPYLDSGAGFS